MTIRLQAWSEESVELTAAQAARVQQSGLARALFDEPPDRWRLATDSHVGVLSLNDGLELRVAPRLAIPRLMFLLSYSGDATAWRGPGPAYSVDEDLFTAVAAAFALHAERALQPAPLRGYVTLQERSTVLRGRLRIGEQLARWPGRYLPLEISTFGKRRDKPAWRSE